MDKKSRKFKTVVRFLCIVLGCLLGFASVKRGFHC